MQTSFDLYFASSNRHKFLEAKAILETFGIKLGFFKCNLTEIQSDKIRDIAFQKSIDAYHQCKKPIIVEDDGLFIDSLNGFPGPFSSYVYKTIGNQGILKLVKRNRKANFQSVISYCDKKIHPKLFEAQLVGKINKNSTGKGWGYDPIFIPNGKKKTFAELSDKNEISHRYKALKKFSSWFANKPE